MSSTQDAVLGRIALHYKLVTQETLNAALQRQAAGTQKNLGELLVELKAITGNSFSG